MTQKFILKVVSIGVLMLGFVQASFAQLTVIDPTNLIQNSITAAKQIQSEIYQNTNIVYQYQMMLNQLKQATNLNPSAMMAQYNQISSDINSVTKYSNTLQSLYGELQNNAQYLTKVQSLVTQSNKTPQQWLTDQSTLISNNDSTAKTLFQQGNDVMAHVQTLATRRQEIQSQLEMSPTQEATAQLTTHMLDIVASQNSDMLQMMATKQQSAATAESASNADALAKNAAQQALQNQYDKERAALTGQVFTGTMPAQ